MLARKMFRDMKHNFGQFFSVFILAMLAMAMYVTFEGHVLSEENARKVFHKECNTADLWVYGESFSKEQLEDIRNLSFVEDAQLRTKLSGSAPDCGDMADVARCYLEESGQLGELPAHLQNYIDYAAYGRDMELEGTFVVTNHGVYEILR